MIYIVKNQNENSKQVKRAVQLVIEAGGIQYAQDKMETITKEALVLIENIEKTNRSFYGGAIGVLDFEGNFNHAIMIRSFLSKNHTLHFQAGAGIVESSSEENEMQEVYNKLSALQKALDLAENI